MPRVDLDFQRYVALHKGAREASTREGAAYAYAGDLKVLRTLDRLRPVRLALESAGRVWRKVLEGAAKATPTENAKIFAIAAHAAQLLHVRAPHVWIAPALDGAAQVFGTNEDPHVVVSREAAESLTEPELLDVCGRECGRIQNNHVIYATAVYYLDHDAGTFLRWIVAPARLALRGWARRAQLTADRAGLLCVRDLAVSEAAIAKTATDGDPETPKRIEALRVFAESAYYKGVIGQSGGLSAAECDTKVAEILK